MAILEVVNKVAKDNPSLVDTSPITRKLLRALPEGIAVHEVGRRVVVGRRDLGCDSPADATISQQ